MLMHVCHGIYRLGFTTYLQPVAAALGFDYLKRDFILKEWKMHDQFLLMFCDAVAQWLHGNCTLVIIISGDKISNILFM